MTRSIGITFALVAALAWSGWTISGSAILVAVRACRTSTSGGTGCRQSERREQAAVRSVDDAVGELGALGKG